MKNDCIPVGLCSSYRSYVLCWRLGVRLWCMERVVDVVIRLFLKNYSKSELSTLYNALARARAAVETATPSNPMKDLDEALQYLCGYADAKGESEK